MTTKSQSCSAEALAAMQIIQQRITELVVGVITQTPHPLPDDELAEIIDRQFPKYGEMREALQHWNDMRAVEFDSNGNVVLRLSEKNWQKLVAALQRGDL